MFSNWFSGDDLERYRTSPHKQRMDGVASSLVRLRYASEVIHQHLHEWLRFSHHLDANESCPLPEPNAEIVRQYVAQRKADCGASRSRGLRASVRIFLEADEQGRFRRRVGCPPSTPAWFGPILTLYLQFVRGASRAGPENGKEVHPKAIGVCSVPGGRRRDPAQLHYARARSRVL